MKSFIKNAVLSFLVLGLYSTYTHGYLSSVEEEPIKGGKVLGYSLNHCYSYGSESRYNYCSKKDEKEIKKVLDKAKAMKEPNFDKNKKVVQSFYSFPALETGEKFNPKKKYEYFYSSDVFVVDEENKKLYLLEYDTNWQDSKFDRKNKKAPTVITQKDKDWICLYEQGSAFGTSNAVNKGSDDSYVCAFFFKRKDFETQKSEWTIFVETSPFKNLPPVDYVEDD